MQKNSVVFLASILFFSLSFCQWSYAHFHHGYDASNDDSYYGSEQDDDVYPSSQSYYDTYHSHSHHHHGYYYSQPSYGHSHYYNQYYSSSYSSRMPDYMPGLREKVVVVDPRAHAWGAYSSDGSLLREGLATSGSSWCPDLGRPCRTKSGTFRIYSLGTRDCYSHKFPLPRGGAPMPYCMYFNGGQGLHGSHEVVDGNISHGCVRMHVEDAEWIRFNFANVGTKVVVRSY